MKAREGFVATSFAVLFAVVLGMVAMYAFGLAVLTSKEETRMTLEMERSLYPIAWSTTNAVLEHLMANAGSIASSISDDVSFDIHEGAVGVHVRSIVSGDKTKGVRVTTGATRLDNAARIANGILSSDVIARGFLSPDAVSPPTWTIVWR